MVFLAVWGVGMFLCWGWTMFPWSPDAVVDRAGTPYSVYFQRFGFSDWLVRQELVNGAIIIIEWHVVPRGLAVALIVTAVSSLILYVAWRAAVNAFTCAAGTCDGCGYDLTGLAQPRCPECGETSRDLIIAKR
ncbi:MAG: hypothetical protein KJZ69_10130 [Phycisphaerales bacterium]|nr:hypothetical protein [Phycisphaerales bacterium]